MQNMTNPSRVALLALVMICASASTTAFEVGNQIEFHGYGDLTYVRSNVDATGQRLGARQTDHDVSFVATWQVDERTKLWAQLGKNREVSWGHVDWVFVDYQTASGQTWRLGKIPLTFGLHSDARDVQALRPSASLPLVYAENLALVDESITGASGKQRFDWGSQSATVEAYAATVLTSDGNARVRGPVGGARVIIETPLEGLTLRASGYRGRFAMSPGDQQRNKYGWAVSARFAGERLDLQAELARGFAFDHGVSAWYAQAAYTLDANWQAMARIEQAVTDTAQSSDDAYRERRLTLGLAYTINQYLGLRLEQRFHRGYASMVAGEVLEAGQGRQRWTSTLMSVNYLF